MRTPIDQLKREALAGWTEDDDGWFWRKSRNTDPKLGQPRVDLGFDESTFPSSPKENRIYVRSAEIAASIDRGVLPPGGFDET